MAVGLDKRTTSMRVDLCRISATLLSCCGDRCLTTTKAIPGVAGIASSKRVTAAKPPAEAPKPTTGKLRPLRGAIGLGSLDCTPTFPSCTSSPEEDPACTTGSMAVAVAFLFLVFPTATLGTAASSIRVRTNLVSSVTEKASAEDGP